MSYISSLSIGQKWINKISKQEEKVVGFNISFCYDSRGIMKPTQYIIMSSGHQTNANNLIKNYAPRDVFFTRKK
jgi:hypothetical protein